MPRGPPTKIGGKHANDGGAVNSSSNAGAKKFHWNLRSFNETRTWSSGGSISTTRTSKSSNGSNTLLPAHPEIPKASSGSISGEDVKNGFRHHRRSDQCASEIFRSLHGGGDDEDHNAKEDTNVRVGIVDGREVHFELRENLTQKPPTDRRARLRRSLVSENAERSSIGVRVRLWLMKIRLVHMSAIYLASFMALNVIFAGLFYAYEGGCCDDSSLDFSQVFDFSIQTSTTIGYGGYVPIGYYSNFLVVLLSFFSTLLNTMFAGLMFTKFVTPIAKIEFSDVLTLSNVNGLPCLQLRVGNADGHANPLIDVSARLSVTYVISYHDEQGSSHQFGHTADLKLLNDRRHNLAEAWTLRHVVDETSPLFGLDFSEPPGNKIVEFQVCVSAIQKITKAGISEQTGYLLEDLLIGHTFVDQLRWDRDSRTMYCDYAKMSETHPQAVWYPAKRVVMDY
jgi:inward rectifier potassium channel